MYTVYAKYEIPASLVREVKEFTESKPGYYKVVRRPMIVSVAPVERPVTSGWVLLKSDGEGRWTPVQPDQIRAMIAPLTIITNDAIYHIWEVKEDRVYYKDLMTGKTFWI